MLFFLKKKKLKLLLAEKIEVGTVNLTSPNYICDMESAPNAT